MAPTTESPGRGRPRSSTADAAIRTATIDLLGEVGIDKLSMDALATRAGVSKATIYRRWSSKEELVIDALRSLIQPFDDVDTGSLRTDLERYLDAVVERSHTGPIGDVLPHLLAAATRDQAIRRSLDDFVRFRRQPLRTILERGVARGELSAEEDLDVVHELLIGPIFYRTLLRHQTVPTTYITRLLDHVL